MGELAETVQAYLSNCFAEIQPNLTWQTEYDIGGTPVDIAGTSEETLVLIELEWRRADPADNSAKLFRHLSTGQIDHHRVIAVQVFTGYYDLAHGGVSSKRKNAEFVGRTAADSVEKLSYYSADFSLEPPKRGEDWPDDWKHVAEDTIAQIRTHTDS